jgi:hypothetical protein
MMEARHTMFRFDTLTRAFAITLCVLPFAAAMAQNHNSDTFFRMNIPKSPATKQQPVTDDYFGHKVVDPYRWLEDGNSPETQQWVAEQLAYTRSILDALPGRDQLHQRLERLLQIGNLGETQVGGGYYLHTRREGTQNQPVLYVRQSVDGHDQVLLDVNLLSKDGTVALDWWNASHDGKYVAYGTSESGSEMSTLHVIETATRKLLPDTIARTQACSLAMEARRQRLLLHAISQGGRRRRRTRDVQPTRLLPSDGRRSRERPAHLRRGPRSAGLAQRLAVERWTLAQHHGRARLVKE